MACSPLRLSLKTDGRQVPRVFARRGGEAPFPQENFMSRNSFTAVSIPTAEAPGGRPGTRELGPSDLSDTGSDTIGTGKSDDDSDAAGTGEGRDAGGTPVPEASDLRPDHLVDEEVDPDEAAEGE
jgi:hypothetical protein